MKFGGCFVSYILYHVASTIDAYSLNEKLTFSQSL